MADPISTPPAFAAGTQFSLAGPNPRPDSARMPVRGDLAHVRLAGQVFVPHYAQPLARKVGHDGAALLASPFGEPLAQLPAGTILDTLDIAGGHAWGEVGVGGPIGYIALTQLEP